jgi:hypothetical protein
LAKITTFTIHHEQVGGQEEQIRIFHAEDNLHAIRRKRRPRSVSLVTGKLVRSGSIEARPPNLSYLL